MMTPAQTAPLTGGVDHLETELTRGEKDLAVLADKRRPEKTDRCPIIASKLEELERMQNPVYPD